MKEKNASRGRHRTWAPRDKKPASIWLLHVDKVEANAKQQVRIRAIHPRPSVRPTNCARDSCCGYSREFVGTSKVAHFWTVERSAKKCITRTLRVQPSSSLDAGMHNFSKSVALRSIHNPLLFGWDISTVRAPLTINQAPTPFGTDLQQCWVKWCLILTCKK